MENTVQISNLQMTQTQLPAFTAQTANSHKYFFCINKIYSRFTFYLSSISTASFDLTKVSMCHVSLNWSDILHPGTIILMA